MNFSLGIIPWLSPDALHPGWRRSPQAHSSQVRFMRTLLVSPDFIADEIPATGGHRRFIRRARSTTPFSQTSVFLSDTAGTNLIRSVKQYPLNGSRGRSPLVQGYGGRTGPCFVSFSVLKRPFPLVTQLSPSLPPCGRRRGHARASRGRGVRRGERSRTGFRAA